MGSAAALVASWPPAPGALFIYGEERRTIYYTHGLRTTHICNYAFEDRSTSPPHVCVSCEVANHVLGSSERETTADVLAKARSRNRYKVGDFLRGITAAREHYRIHSTYLTNNKHTMSKAMLYYWHVIILDPAAIIHLYLSIRIWKACANSITAIRMYELSQDQLMQVYPNSIPFTYFVPIKGLVS